MPGFSEQVCNELRDRMKELEAANRRLLNEYLDLVGQEREISSNLVAEEAAAQSARHKLQLQVRICDQLTQEWRYCLEIHPPETCDPLKERLEAAGEVETQFAEEMREHLTAVRDLQATRSRLAEEMKQNDARRQTNWDRIGDIRKTMNGGHCGSWRDDGGYTGYPPP